MSNIQAKNVTTTFIISLNCPLQPPSFRRFTYLAISFIILNKMNTEHSAKLRGIQACCIVGKPTYLGNVLRFRQATEENNFGKIVKFGAIVEAEKNPESLAGAVKFEGSLLHCVHLSSSFGSSFCTTPTSALALVGTPLSMTQSFATLLKIRFPRSRNLIAALLLSALCISLTACLSSTPIATPRAAESNTSRPATLDDFWDGAARFEIEIEDTGLPMGESDTLIMGDGSWRSYLHASNQSLGVIDPCGAPVDFPGCLVTFTSHDAGKSFVPTVNESGVPVCQIPCTQCPCDSRRDHIDQQQYPHIAWLSTGDPTSSAPDQWLLTYEYRANTILRRSSDGLNWSAPAELPMTGVWQSWLMPCRPEAAIGAHPYAPASYDCLTGSPPGILVDDTTNSPQIYLFVGLGQNPSGMGCFRGPLNGPASLLRACDHNPLFTGAADYGPLESIGSTNADAYFDFRTISSADIVRVGERYYLFYEGVRGPGQGDQGDTQFLLGVARSTSNALDGDWELYTENPILLNLPGNVGVGHADVVIARDFTYLYTSLDGIKRSRLRLVWK